jgi:hypothetical protein
MRTSPLGGACFADAALVWMREAVGMSICAMNGLSEVDGVCPSVIGSAGKPTLSQMA